MTLEESLLRDEGERLQVYDDTTGKPLKPGTMLIGVPTIGVGKNLLVGITVEESRYLLQSSIAQMRHGLRAALPEYESLSPIRQLVLENMAFNLGVTGLLKFKATLAAIQAGDYDRAADQMLKSKWRAQVKGRAIRLAFMMRTNREEA